MAPEQCTASENDEAPLELPPWAGLTTAFLAYRIQNMDPTAVRVGVATAHNSHEPYIDCRQDDSSTTFNIFVNAAHVQLVLPGQHAKKSTIKFATKVPDDDDEWEVSKLALCSSGSKKTRKKNEQARRKKKELRQKAAGNDVPEAPPAVQGGEGPDVDAVKDKAAENEPVEVKPIEHGSVKGESINDGSIEDNSIKYEAVDDETVRDRTVEPRPAQDDAPAQVAGDHNLRATDPSTSHPASVIPGTAAPSTDAASTGPPDQGASPSEQVPDAEHCATPAPPAAAGVDDMRGRHGTAHRGDPPPKEEALSWADMVEEEEEDQARWEKARAAGKDLPKGAETPWWKKPLRFSSGAVVHVPEPRWKQPTAWKPYIGRAARSRWR